MELLFDRMCDNHIYYYYLCNEEEYARESQGKNEFTIEVKPQVHVSDGFACYGGRDFKAIGVSEHERFSSTYYIKPNSIEKNEMHSAKHYWV